MTCDAGLMQLIVPTLRAGTISGQNSIRTSPFGTLQHDRM